MVMQKKQQAIRNIRTVREYIHNTLLLQVMMQWKNQAQNEKMLEEMKQTHEKTCDALKQQSQQQIAELENTLHTSVRKSEELQSQMKQQAKQQSLLSLQAIMQHANQQKALLAFFFWRNRLVELSTCASSTELKNEIAALQEAIESVSDFSFIFINHKFQFQ